MGTYSNHTCHICQIKRSAQHMKQVEVRQKSGSTGWGVSFNPNRKNSTRIRAPRNYYSIRKKWECAHRDAHDNPQYYAELEARLARERAEKEARLKAERKERARLQKIKNQKAETKTAIIKAINDQLTPTKLTKTSAPFKPLIADNEIQTAISHIREDYGDEMQRVSDWKIVSEILKNGTVKVSTPLKSQKNLKFRHGVSSDEKIASKIFVIAEKPKTGFLKLTWNCLITLVKISFYLATLGVGYIVHTTIRDYYYAIRNKRPYVYHHAIYRLSRKIERNFGKSSVFSDTIESVKSNEALTSLPYFKEIRPEVIREEAWGSVSKKRSSTTKKAISASSKKNENQTVVEEPSDTPSVLQRIYESDEFFDICMIVLMRLVGGADGNLTQDEMDLIKSKYSVSKDSEILIAELLEKDGHQDDIIKILRALFTGNVPVLEMIINNLMTLAEADGEVSSSEIEAIHSIGKKLGLNKRLIGEVIENENFNTEEDENFKFFDDETFPRFEEIYV